MDLGLSSSCLRLLRARIIGKCILLCQADCPEPLSLILCPTNWNLSACRVLQLHYYTVFLPKVGHLLPSSRFSNTFFHEGCSLSHLLLLSPCSCFLLSSKVPFGVLLKCVVCLVLPVYCVPLLQDCGCSYSGVCPPHVWIAHTQISLNRKATQDFKR